MRIVFHLRTVTISCLLYQPTSILFLLDSSSVITRSLKAINFSCEDWNVDVNSGKPASIWLLFADYYCYLCVLNLGFWFHTSPPTHSKQKSLSNPTDSSSSAMSKWSRVFHCWWSQSGTLHFPLAFNSHILLSLAFRAFLVLSSWAPKSRGNETFVRDLVAQYHTMQICTLNELLGFMDPWRVVAIEPWYSYQFLRVWIYIDRWNWK